MKYQLGQVLGRRTEENKIEAFVIVSAHMSRNSWTDEFFTSYGLMPVGTEDQYYNHPFEETLKSKGRCLEETYIDEIFKVLDI